MSDAPDGHAGEMSLQELHEVQQREIPSPTPVEQKTHAAAQVGGWTVGKSENDLGILVDTRLIMNQQSVLVGQKIPTAFWAAIGSVVSRSRKLFFLLCTGYLIIARCNLAIGSSAGTSSRGEAWMYWSKYSKEPWRWWRAWSCCHKRRRAGELGVVSL